MTRIDYALKVKCVMASESLSMREVYEQVFVPEYGTRMSYETFRHKLRDWKRKRLADEATLCAGTYPEFAAHNATVQVSADGRITQAWIKQHRDPVDWLKIREIITKDAPQSTVEPTTLSGDTMLEIPLFDLHFGVASFDTYKNELSEILGLISEKNYDEINILVGQDSLHNNDMRGHTARGTPIEQVEFTKSWADAWRFFRALIDASLLHSPNVKVRYSKGNHDECSSWCLLKALEAVYPQCSFDDGLAPRKCISWNGCFIGFGHCDYTNKSSVLFQNFVLDFPEEFAQAKVREVHSGHFHRESCDEGIMIRRLPTAVPTDDWSSNNGYVGAHKRFQLFEWGVGRLKAIYYV